SEGVFDGEWSCEAGVECQLATVSVRGSQFSGRLESNPQLKGQPCDGMKFPPAPPSTGGCHIVFEFTGLVDGSTVNGVVAATAPESDSLGCAIPSERHRFSATIRENGRVIAISTEVNETIYHYHDART